MFLSLLVSSALGIAYNKLIRHTRIPQIQLRVTYDVRKERIHMAQSNKRSKALVTQSSVTKRIMTDLNLYTDGSHHQQFHSGIFHVPYQNFHSTPFFYSMPWLRLMAQSRVALNKHKATVTGIFVHQTIRIPYHIRAAVGYPLSIKKCFKILEIWYQITGSRSIPVYCYCNLLWKMVST